MSSSVAMLGLAGPARRDQHPAAHAGPLRQLVQGPAAAVPSLPDPVADSPGDTVAPARSSSSDCLTKALYCTIESRENRDRDGLPTGSPAATLRNPSMIMVR